MSEICLILNPCDFVVSMTPLVNVLGSLTGPAVTSRSPGHVSPVKVAAGREKKHAVPWLTSSDLTLIYADLASVRVFVPRGGVNKGDNQNTTAGNAGW